MLKICLIFKVENYDSNFLKGSETIYFKYSRKIQRPFHYRQNGNESDEYEVTSNFATIALAISEMKFLHDVQ
jgi:hypothetical protein